MVGLLGLFFDLFCFNKVIVVDYFFFVFELEDEYLVFGVDFFDGDFGDFNLCKCRKFGGNNKEKVVFGIFVLDSEDDDGLGKKWKCKIFRNKGMSFVFDGVVK